MLASLHGAGCLSGMNGEHSAAQNGGRVSPRAPRQDFVFPGLSELDRLAGEPMTTTRTPMLSAFCFSLYFREAGHKSKDLKT